MNLLAFDTEVKCENKSNFLSKVFMPQQVKLHKVPENAKLLPLPIPKNREEVIYRKNGKSVDKVHEFDFATGAKVKTTHYDYFNDKKVRSIDEFDIETGKILKTTNFILYKSIDEYDIESGKKRRTINFNIKDENKISSIQEYCLEYEKIVRVYIYRKDSSDVSIIKELNPKNGKVVKWTSYKEGSGKKSSVSEYDSDHGKPVKTTYFYEDGVTVKDVHEYNKTESFQTDIQFEKVIPAKSNYKNVKELDSHTKEHMAKLIDNLFRKNNLKFECI